MSDDANAEPVNISHALGTELLALLDILARHGLSPRGFVKRSGVAEHDKLGTASALATELLRLSGILRDRGEEGDAERLTAAAKKLKGEIAKSWLGRAMIAAFVEDRVAAAQHARRCLDAMDWSPGYGPPSVTARLQMANLVADAYIDSLLGAQRSARVRTILYWQCSLRPLSDVLVTMGRTRLLDLGVVENDGTRRRYAGYFVDALVQVVQRLLHDPDAKTVAVLPEDAEGDHRATRQGYTFELLQAGRHILPEHLDCAFHSACALALMALGTPVNGLDTRSTVEGAVLMSKWALGLLERFKRREAGVYVTDEGAMSILAPRYVDELRRLLVRLQAPD
ncbi:MAG: hypothetical protein KIT12_02570 [Trueperaceae bacterium]|nr:hypothetical protein [Trueperaceae bacterium]